MAGRYLPGAKVRLEDIRQAFGVSWSPIREAVTRLVSEGLMVVDSQKGYRVAPATRAELEEAIRLRVLLETQALRLAISLGGDAWEAQLLAAHHRLSKLESQRDIQVCWQQVQGEFQEAVQGSYVKAHQGE